MRNKEIGTPPERHQEEEESHTFDMSEGELGDINLPPQLLGAPLHIQYIWLEQKRDRAAARNRDLILDRRLFKLERSVASMCHKLGEESPDGDGGTGFIGEVRRATQEISKLQGERNFVRGAIAAIAAAGTLLVYGFSAWIKSVIQAPPK